MSERRATLRASGQQPPSSTEGPQDLASASIGEYLKRQRTLRGIGIEDLAASTRIPLRSLERLEAGYFDGVTDGFVRGFVRTVAVALGLDADQTVARMLDEPVGGKWDRASVGVARRQLLGVSALVLIAVVAGFGLRAAWRSLVGETPGGASRARVVWRDPVHQLARDHAEGRFVVRPPPVPLPAPGSAIEPAQAAAPEGDGGFEPGFVPGAPFESALESSREVFALPAATEGARTAEAVFETETETETGAGVDASASRPASDPTPVSDAAPPAIPDAGAAPASPLDGGAESPSAPQAPTVAPTVAPAEAPTEARSEAASAPSGDRP